MPNLQQEEDHESNDKRSPTLREYIKARDKDQLDLFGQKETPVLQEFTFKDQTDGNTATVVAFTVEQAIEALRKVTGLNCVLIKSCPATGTYVANNNILPF